MTTTIAPDRRVSRRHIFTVMMIRDLHVLRGDLTSFVTRVALQPALFVLLFGYILPKLGGAGGMAGSPGTSASTVLIPGLVGSTMLTAGIVAVTQPLIMELAYTREIEDRLLAPTPTWHIGLQKIVSGAVQALFAGLIVFVLAYFVHAGGQGPDVSVTNIPLLVLMLLAAAVLSASLGLLAGTVVDPRKTATLFTVVIFPATFLGCVFYPWSALEPIRWLQVLSLINPLVYVNEGLRAALTPQVPHLPAWAYLTAITVGTALIVWYSLRAFVRRVSL